MDESCDVAIVGGGVIGCSIAFHLGRMGASGVRILEREPLPGAGSTAKANGGIRAQFTTEVNVAMSLASMEILDALASQMGEPPLYRKAGYLFVTDASAKLRAMEEAVEWQRGHRVTVGEHREREVRAKAPWVRGRIAGGTFGARSWNIDPGGVRN